LKQYYTNWKTNFIGGWHIDSLLCDSMVGEIKRLSSGNILSHSRGYSLVSSTDIDPAILISYKIQLSQVINQYTTLYPHSKETIANWRLNPLFNLQHYAPGHSYSVYHCENNGMGPFKNRHLAFMTYLNTVTDGGETEFLHQKLKVKPEKGLTLVWPAHWTHIHRGLPAPNQEKYVTTGWFDYIDEQAEIFDGISEDSQEDFMKKLNSFEK